MIARFQLSARGTWGNALLFVSLLAFPYIAADWPQFRGPTHNGVCTDLIITNWTGSVTNPLWRVGVTNALSSLAVSDEPGCAFRQLDQVNQPCVFNEWPRARG